MVNYICEKCGYITIRKSDFDKHLNRKYSCISEDTTSVSTLTNPHKSRTKPHNSRTNPHKPAQTRTNPAQIQIMKMTACTVVNYLPERIL